MESTEDLKGCRAILLTPPLATLHPSPTMGGECHAVRKPTPALPKGGNAMRTESPPLPSQREGMPCGQGAHPYPPKGRECHADREPTPALPKGGNAMRTGSPPSPSQREGMPCGLIVYDFEACVLSAAAPLLLGGVGGRLPQRSSSPPIVGEG